VTVGTNARISTIVPVKSVLFVCAGNICRSPIAEGLFRRIAQSRPALASIEVGSAGTIAMDGNRPLRETRQVAFDEFGLDLSSHRARNAENLSADLILTMDHRVTREAERLGMSGRIVMIGDYAGDGEVVEDPYGGVLEVHRACARIIERLVAAAADRLEREAATV
jgi:protein-tyrosine phosphatase